MKKKDFWTLIGCDAAIAVLILEHLAGLEVAIHCLSIWTIITLIIHIAILKEYIVIGIGTAEEDI